MSSFCGKMFEYDNISIDRFDKENLQNSAFFLSHCHKDHMQGLESDSLLQRLQSSSDIKLYCTEISRNILLNMDSGRYKHLSKHVVMLEFEVATTILVPTYQALSNTSVTVTAIPSGHCPGSAMFLFEGTEGTVLYTGDFRLKKGSAAKISALHSGSSVKLIKSMYVDTTFCSQQCRYIPEREPTTQLILELTDEWLKSSPRSMVLVNSKATLGYENIFIQLAIKFKQKVHVDDHKLAYYSKIPEIAPHVTGDPSATRIHACGRKGKKRALSKLPCGYTMKSQQSIALRTISVSTMWFYNQEYKLEELIVKLNPNQEWYKACYSFHSSDDEIRDLVSYVKPKRVYPNVIPLNSSLDEVQKRLNSFLESPSVSAETFVIKPLGQLKRRRIVCEEQTDHGEDSDDGLMFDDYSPKIFKKRKQYCDDSRKSDSIKITDKCANGDHKSAIVHDEENEISNSQSSNGSLKFTWSSTFKGFSNSDIESDDDDDEDDYETDEECEHCSHSETEEELLDENAQSNW